MRAFWTRGSWWWLAVPALIGGVTLVWSNATRARAVDQAEMRMAGVARQFQDEAKAEMERQLRSLGELAQRGYGGGWDLEAHKVLGENPGLLAVAWVGRNSSAGQGPEAAGPLEETVRTAQPSIYLSTLQRMHAMIQVARGPMLAKMVSENRVQVSDAIPLPNRGKAFAAYAPTTAKNTVSGAVMGVFHLQILMDRVFEKSIPSGYSMQIVEGYQTLYERGETKNDASDLETKDDIEVFGSKWQMRLWPDFPVRQAGRQEAERILIGGGGLSAILFGIVALRAWRRPPHMPPTTVRKGDVAPSLSLLAPAASEASPPPEARYELWEMALANLEEALFVADPVQSENGARARIRYVNETLARLAEMRAEDLVGKELGELVERGARQGAEAQLRKGMATEKSFRVPLPLHRKDKNALEAQLRMKPIFGPRNEVAHWLGYLKATEEPRKESLFARGFLDRWPLAAAISGETGILLDWNPAAERLTGVPASALLGRATPFVTIDGEAAQPGLQLREVALGPQPKRKLTIWTAELDDRRRLHLLAEPPAQGEETPSQEAPGGDWMDRVAKGKVPQSREAEFRALAEHASEILAILTPDTTVEYSNAAAKQWLDLETGGKVPEEWPLSELRQADTAFAARGADGTVREMEGVLNLVDGSQLMVLNARPRAAYAENHTASPEWFLNAVQDVIVTFDDEHRVIWMNRAAEDLYGIGAGQAKGKSFGELLPEWLQVPGRPYIQQSLDESGFWRGEISSYTPSGREIVQDASITATSDAAGRRNGAVAVCRDVTEKKKAVETFQAGETARALNAIGNSDGLWDWNLRTDEVYFSPRWKEMLGYSENEICGDLEEWHRMVHEADLPNLKQKIGQHLRGQSEHLEAEYRIRSKSGEYRWMLTRAMAARNAEGQALRLVGLQTDIHEQKNSEEQLLFEAFHDSLTGLANRALFLDRVNGMLSARRPAFTVAFLDLAGFGAINAELGARGGDRALAEAARRISECIPNGGFLARHGSDEFVAMLPEDRTETQREFTEHVEYRLGKPYFYAGKTVRFRANLGFAASTSASESGETLLQAASRAMAASKAGVEAATLSASPLGDELRLGLQREEFRVFYHPIIKLDTGEIAGIEALVRWQHPQRGLLTPGDFLSEAEESGQILEIDRWVLREACAKAIAINEKFRRVEPLVLTVNLSRNHFAQAESTAKLTEILDQSEISPRLLRVEMKERALHNSEGGPDWAVNLGRLRVQLSLDDYCESAETLRNFDELPVDRVKLDASLVRGLSTGRNREKVRDIIAEAEIHNMLVVAEGVETLEQVAVLRELKCHLAQGFYFTLPASAVDTEKLLARSPRW